MRHPDPTPRHYHSHSHEHGTIMSDQRSAVSGRGRALKKLNLVFTKYMANDGFSEPPRCADSKFPLSFFAESWVRVTAGAQRGGGGVSVGRIFRGPSIRACFFFFWWGVGGLARGLYRPPPPPPGVESPSAPATGTWGLSYRPFAVRFDHPVCGPQIRFATQPRPKSRTWAGPRSGATSR